MKKHTLLVKKVSILLLSALLIHGQMMWSYSPSENSLSIDDHFAAALDDYQKGSYKQAAAKLEPVLNQVKVEDPGFISNIYLLLGACYEQSGENEKAKEYYQLLKEIHDNGSIEQIPAVAGVDTEILKLLRQVFEEKSFFDFNEPTPVSKIINNNVVHAPRKSVEQKQKEKKKKKFPWLIAVGAVVVAGVAAVLLLTQKISEKELVLPDIEWIKIPAGEFIMGDNFGEGEADELPVHKVYLGEYFISKYEISYGHYDTFCEDTGRRKIDRSASAGTMSSYPVQKVSWNDAVAFCAWLSQKKGENITLPTEAQWEKAARGTKQYRYPWGNSPPDCYKARYQVCVDSGQGPLPNVELRAPGMSPYEVFNMAGNVAEWCLDWYDASYYAISPVNNPGGPGSGSFRVIRGGSRKSDIFGIRSANRDFKFPEYVGDETGFRIVKLPQ